jgi:NADH:ubiquinone oxidoreductase subunit 6 (subunit J)
MNAETLNAILVFLGAVVVAVLFILDRQGKRLSQSIPPELLPVLLGLLALAETLAKTTPTTSDDELIAKIKAALNNPPNDDGAAMNTPEDLAVRLGDTPPAQG